MFLTFQIMHEKRLVISNLNDNVYIEMKKNVLSNSEDSGD